MNVRKFEKNTIEVGHSDIVVWRQGDAYGSVMYVGKVDENDYALFHIIRFQRHGLAPNISEGDISENTFESVPHALESLQPDEVIIFKNWQDLGFFLSQNLSQ